MRSSILVLITVTLGPPMAALGALDEKTLRVTIESTLQTSSKQILQFAFDGDPETYFASTDNPRSNDHFTLVLGQSASFERVKITTGRPDETDKLEAGSLELSGDGKTFEEVAKFAGGIGRFESKPRPILAIRIKPSMDSAHPLVIREIDLKLTEPLKPFKYPIEFTVDVTDAPEMSEWANKVAKLCEQWYPTLNEELKSDGYQPPTQISMALKSDYRGVAEASGAKIKGSVKFFKDHPDDLGAMIHETCHVIQRYRSRSNPGWLVEGVADYVRFFVFEPGQAGPVNPAKAHYNQSYRTTATFLAFVSARYDKQLVLKLNKLMREGKYKEEVFKDLTGKTVQELDQEWLESLKK